MASLGNAMSEQGWDQHRLMVMDNIKRLSDNIESLTTAIEELKQSITAHQTETSVTIATINTRVDTLWRAVWGVAVIAVTALASKLLNLKVP